MPQLAVGTEGQAGDQAPGQPQFSDLGGDDRIGDIFDQQPGLEILPQVSADPQVEVELVKIFLGTGPGVLQVFLGVGVGPERRSRRSRR